MGDVVRLTRARAKRAAKKRVRTLWEEGKVIFSNHAIRNLAERGLDANDVQHVIRYGAVKLGGSSDYAETPKRYILEGKSVEGDPIVCVVDVDGSLVVVTAFPKG